MWKLIYQFSSPFCDTVSTNIHQPASDPQPQLEHWKLMKQLTKYKMFCIFSIQQCPPFQKLESDDRAEQLSILIHLDAIEIRSPNFYQVILPSTATDYCYSSFWPTLILLILDIRYILQIFYKTMTSMIKFMQLKLSQKHAGNKLKKSELSIFD